MEHLSKFKLGIVKRSSFKITIHFLSFECLFIIYIRVTKKVTKLGFVEYFCMPSGFKKEYLHDSFDSRPLKCVHCTVTGFYEMNPNIKIVKACS